MGIRVLRLQQFVIGILSTTIGIYWNSFQFFPPTVWSVTICMEYTICMECTVLNSIAQLVAALQSLCRALQMSRVHVSKKAILRGPHSNRASHTNRALRRCSTLHKVVFTILAETRKKK